MKELTDFQVDLFKRLIASEKVQYLINRNKPCECKKYNELDKRDCCYSVI